MTVTTTRDPNDPVCPDCRSGDTWPNRHTKSGVIWFCAACGSEWEIKS